MVEISESTFVRASPQEVWDFLSDAGRYPEGIYFVREVFDISPGPMREGWVYHERAKPGPMESVSEWTVTRFDPPVVQVHEGSMPEMEAALTMRLTPKDEGTYWKHSMRFRMLPAFRPLGWVLERTIVKRKMAADFRKILAAARGLIEGDGTRRGAAHSG